MEQSRTGRALIDATKPYTEESRARSWFEVGSTLAVIGVCLAVAAAAPHWAVRLLGTVVGGLTIVRGFILYHDFMHGAILVRSKPAKWLMYLYGLLVLTPPRVWRQTHNYHHAHTCKVVGSHVGSYPVLTTEMWEKATSGQRLMYRVVRHPLTVLAGYLTIFIYGMCISPFRRRPKGNWDSAAALVLHLAIVGTVGFFAGVDVALFAVVGPLAIATAAGAYLFYAQHNFEGMHIQPRETWEFDRAALESSSYMKLGPVMRWFTGNIGYHHVHHLNPRIPFYRLPEAMDGVPELQDAHETTLWPSDIAECFRLKLWDADAGRMVPFPRR